MKNMANVLTNDWLWRTWITAVIGYLTKIPSFSPDNNTKSRQNVSGSELRLNILRLCRITSHKYTVLTVHIKRKC